MVILLADLEQQCSLFVKDYITGGFTFGAAMLPFCERLYYWRI